MVEDKVDSNYLPVIVWLRGGRENGVNKNVTKYRERKRGKVRWTEQEKKEFTEKFGVGGVDRNGIEEEWSGLKGRIEDALGDMERRGDSEGRSG